MTDFDREILLGFYDEAAGYLPAIRTGLAALAADPARAAEVLEEPHRCVHTIKGASAMVGLSGLSHIAFHLEEVVELWMHEPEAATPDLLAGFEVGLGHIQTYLERMVAGPFDDRELTAEAVAHARRLRGLPENPADDPPPPPLAPNLADLIPAPDLGAPAFDLPPPAAPAPVPPAPLELVPAELSAELVEVFRLEAEDHIRAMAGLLPEVRENPADRDRWQHIRRAAHTLKGSAALVGFDDVTRLAHRMEDLLDLFFDGAAAPAPGDIDLLLAATDAIEDAVNGAGVDRVKFADLHAKLGAALAAKPAAAAVPEEAEAPAAEIPAVEAPAVTAPAAEPARPARPAREAAEATVRVPIERLDEIAKLVGELVIARTALEQRVAEFGRLIGEARPAADRLHRVAGRLEAGYEASALAGSRTAGAGAFALAGGGGGDGFDDLEFDRYTEFHLLSRELAESSTDVQTLVGDFGHLAGDFDGHLTRQARLASAVEDKLMRLRMVPVGTIAAKLSRTVRTAAAATGKQAAFVLDGDRTGLDKAVLDAMADPLLHLLRNAVDHGLEAPEVRAALGKPAAGTVTLRAGHEGGSVALTLTDDGRGLDFDAVRAAAVRRGLVPAGAADGLSDDELADFLFRPGFSTKDEVSEMSGRGVGLDVVRGKVEALKGTVTVSSAPGRGTTFTIRLPMTLAVMRALMVKAAGQTYAIPLEAVEQILRPGAGEVDRVGRDAVLRLGAEVVPLVPLARVLRVAGGEPAGDRPPVVVLKSGGRRVALQIDQLLGGREVVIKALGRQLRKLHAVSGATLLGDGSVVFILNPADLARGAAAPAAGPAAPAAAPTSRNRDGLTVLVVDDSPSVRRVLTMLLKGAGWHAVTAKDGTDALDTLHRGPLPDVVLTDVEMPRMDGYELLATIRAEPGLRHIPVAMLTSRAADKHRRKAMELGAGAYVVKPYQDQNLLDVLRQLARAGRPGV